MRLNLDCIRDILFEVEEKSTGTNLVEICSNTVSDRLSKYSFDEVYYHVKQCELTGYFVKAFYDLDGNCSILDLSPKGHEFLANIRADTNWNKVKAKAKSIGSESLSVVTQIASQVIASYLTNCH